MVCMYKGSIYIYDIYIVLYLTSVKIQINDKTSYKSRSLQLGLFTQHGAITDTIAQYKKWFCLFCVDFIFFVKPKQYFSAPLTSET